ncbi:MAG: carboxypeptidase regulatory-like domain-containing protein [Saccharofermentanales bacterium]
MTTNPHHFPQQTPDPRQGQPYPPGYGDPANPAYWGLPGPTDPGRKKKIRITILLVAIGVLLVLAILAGILLLGNKPHRAQGWLDLGDKYLNEMNYEAAIVSFLKVIELEPKNIPARLGLAEVYLLTGQYEEAEARLLEVLAIDDRTIDAYTQLQTLYDLNGNWDKLGKLIEDLRQIGFNQYILFAQVSGSVAGMAPDLGEVPLSDVAISISHQNQSNQTVRSDAQGAYVFYVREGSLEVTYDKYGFSVARESLEVKAGHQVQLPLMLLVPDSGAPGLVSGRVTDQFTGLSLSGALVTAVDDEGRTAGQAEADMDGQYMLELRPGYYNLRTSVEAYSSPDLRILVFSDHLLANQDLFLLPHLEEGEVWIHLSWGSQPLDLDAHLLGPLEGSQQVQINWRTPTLDQGSTRKAVLSGDSRQASGLESLFFRDTSDRLYSFYVHDYSNLFKPNSTALGRSAASVKTLQSDGTILTFTVPQDLTGDVWHVCEIRKGQVTSPRTPQHKIAYISNKLTEGNYGELWSILKGSPLTMSKQLKNSEIEAMKVLGNRTVFDVVNEVGSPAEWMTKTEYIDYVKEWGEISTFGYGGEPHQFWPGSRFPVAEFRKSDWKIRSVGYGDILWGDFYGTNPNPFPFGLKVKMNLPDMVKTLGLDYRAAGLLQSQTMTEAKAYCQRHGIKLLTNHSFVLPSFYEYDEPVPYDDLLVALDQGVIVIREYDLSWDGSDPSELQLHIYLVVQNRDYELLLQVNHKKADRPIQNICVSVKR